MERYTIAQFNKDFPDEDACLERVAAMVYPTWPEAHCRKCEEVTRHHRITGRKAYSCQKCGTHIYPLAGTIFEKSRTPLKSWFYAMYLMSTTRAGISAKQVEREVGVTYKTAWRMFKQIRILMGDDGSGPLMGTVEIDETYIGGRPRHRNAKPDAEPTLYERAAGRKKPGPAPDFEDRKRPVVGMVERGGRVRAWATPDRKTETIRPLINAHVFPEAMIFTDEAKQYDLLKKQGYQHKRVMHSAKVYVDGDVHTNTIEGFWSLLKNGIRGVYHSVGSGYLQSYVDEYTFRYNHRRDTRPMFRSIEGRVSEVRAGQYGDYAPLG